MGMEIKFVKTLAEAKDPVLYSKFIKNIWVLQVVAFPEYQYPVIEGDTGVSVEIPEGFVGIIVPILDANVENQETFSSNIEIVRPSHRDTLKGSFIRTNGQQHAGTINIKRVLFILVKQEEVATVIDRYESKI